MNDLLNRREILVQTGAVAGAALLGEQAAAAAAAEQSASAEPFR